MAEIKQRRFAVAHMNFFDNDLKIKIVDADNWRQAADKAFPSLYWLREDDLGKAKEEASNCDILFNVVEIK